MRAYHNALAQPRPHSQSTPVWLFDLDNTLHNASNGIFAAIDGRMTQTIAELLDLDTTKADWLRRHYWQRYGATLIGLHRHHQIDAHEFLHRCHDFDIAPLLSAETQAAALLQRLPGQKIVFTNAPLHYALQVVQQLGLLPVVEGVWSMEHMYLQGQFRPKPSKQLMQQLLARLPVPAQHVILVEDTLRNLKAAKQLGLQTVHRYHAGTPYSAVHRGRSPYVDLRVASLRELAQRYHQLDI